MKTCRLLLTGMFLLLAAINAKAGTTDTGKHFKPCVKIHHCLFKKADKISVNVGGQHYLQVFDSKGQKLNKYTFTGKKYTLDISSLAKGTYSVYVFDTKMKLLDLKPMVVK